MMTTQIKHTQRLLLPPSPSIWKVTTHQDTQSQLPPLPTMLPIPWFPVTSIGVSFLSLGSNAWEKQPKGRGWFGPAVEGLVHNSEESTERPCWLQPAAAGVGSWHFPLTVWSRNREDNRGGQALLHRGPDRPHLLKGSGPSAETEFQIHMHQHSALERSWVQSCLSFLHILCGRLVFHVWEVVTTSYICLWTIFQGSLTLLIVLFHCPQPSTLTTCKQGTGFHKLAHTGAVWCLHSGAPWMQPAQESAQGWLPNCTREWEQSSLRQTNINNKEHFMAWFGRRKTWKMILGQEYSSTVNHAVGP